MDEMQKATIVGVIMILIALIFSGAIENNKLSQKIALSEQIQYENKLKNEITQNVTLQFISQIAQNAVQCKPLTIPINENLTLNLIDERCLKQTGE